MKHFLIVRKKWARLAGSLPGSLASSLTCCLLSFSLHASHIDGVRAAPPAQRSVENRVALLVNGEAVFTKSFEDRLRFVAISLGLAPTDQSVKALRSSVMRSMIDEILQRQLAEKLSLTVDESDIDKIVSDIEAGNGMKPGGLKTFLKGNGISIQTLRDQIRANLLWMRYIREKYERSLSITPQEQAAFLKRLEKRRLQWSYRIAEIVLYIDDAHHEKKVQAQMQQIMVWLQNGAPFPPIARQFSQSPSASQDGLRGWVAEDDLEPSVNQVLAQLQPGMLSVPIRTASSYVIVALIEKKAPEADALSAPPSQNEIISRLSSERLERLSRLELSALRKRVPVEIRTP